MVKPLIVKELLVEHGIEADHVTIYRWIQRFAPLLTDAARFASRSAGRQVARRRDLCQTSTTCGATPPAPAILSPGAQDLQVTPSEVVTDAASIYPAILDELVC
jgi:hypothetical protein